MGTAGRRLADRLGSRNYDGMSARLFFSKCYGVRGALVHGHVPRPAHDDVGLLAAQLGLFVGHLIAGHGLVEDVLSDQPGLES